MKWDLFSITQVVAGFLVVFLQIAGAMNGKAYDPSHTIVAVGLAASGVGHAVHDHLVHGGK